MEQVLTIFIPEPEIPAVVGGIMVLVYLGLTSVNPGTKAIRVLLTAVCTVLFGTWPFFALLPDEKVGLVRLVLLSLAMGCLVAILVLWSLPDYIVKTRGGKRID